MENTLSDMLNKIDQHKQDRQPFENYSDLAESIELMYVSNTPQNWNRLLTQINKVIVELEETVMEVSGRTEHHGAEVIWGEPLRKSDKVDYRDDNMFLEIDEP